MTASVPPRARVRFWGTRGTCPSPGPRTVRYGGNTPCVEVRVANAPLLILDAGSGLRGLGTQLMQQGHDTPLHMFLTHRHSDHVLGLAHFAPLFSSARRLSICCGDGERVSLHPFIESLLSPPLFPYVDGMTSRLDLFEWQGAEPRMVGGTTISRYTARHPGEAAVFRVDDAHGPLVAYAPDNELAYHDQSAALHAWRAGLVAFLRDVPILVHDATFRREELPQHVGWGHSSADEATQLAMECGARTLVLFHHHPDRDDDAIERMVDESRAMAIAAGVNLRVLAAWEGLTLAV